MKKNYLFLFGVLLFQILGAQGPLITSWNLNTTGDTYNGDSTDIMQVWYTSSTVYVKANGLASYYGGLTHTSVFSADAQDYILEFTRSPVEESGTHETFSGWGGIWLNGTFAGGPGDGRYYDPNSAGLTEWARLAWWFEGGALFIGPNPTNSPYGDLDETYGHSTPQNIYHYHVFNNAMITDITDSSAHSPIVGYAFDGFPIYGPYGYSDANNASSSITRMRSSFQERNITNRNLLPDGSTSTTPPPIDTDYPLGCFEEDYEYVSGSGTLDEHNGRTCVTPEYPNGTYAYFITLNDTLDPDYPYIFGESFFGEKNYTGSLPDVSSIPSGATQYTGTTTGIRDLFEQEEMELFPNPAQNKVTASTLGNSAHVVELFNLQGQRIQMTEFIGGQHELNLSDLAPGVYLVAVTELASGKSWKQKLIRN